MSLDDCLTERERELGCIISDVWPAELYRIILESDRVIDVNDLDIVPFGEGVKVGPNKGGNK